MSAEETLRRIAAHGLPGARGGPLAAGPLQPDEWARLLAGVNDHRLWGLLGAAVAQGALPTSDAQAQRAEGLHRIAMQGVLELESLAIRVCRALEGAGIASRLLKGLAVAHLDEHDPSLRCFNDVDVLVPPTMLPEAIQVLSAMGHHRDLPERRRGFDRRFAKEATMTGATGREIDLHRTLVVGPFGFTIDLEQLWAGEQTVLLAGRPYQALDADRRLVHACFSAVLGDPEPRLPLLRDIGLLLTGGQTDPGQVLALAQCWRGEHALAMAIVAAAETLQCDGWPLTSWARTHRPSRWERRALAAYRSSGGSNTRTLLAGALAPMRTLDRGRYLSALVLPSRDYVRARRRAGRPSEIRTGVRELLARR